MKVRYASLALSLLVSLSAFAADPALKNLDYFAHTWQCKGSQSFTGSPINFTETAAAAWILGGNWLEASVTQMKTKANPQPLHGRAHLGYDPESKRYVLLWADNMGGYEVAESGGWDNNRIVWEGTAHMGTSSAKGRDVFTKAGPKKMTHTYELEQNGKWTEAMQETCTR